MNILVNYIFYQRLFSINLYSEQFFDITVTLGKGKWRGKSFSFSFPPVLLLLYSYCN